MLILDDKHLPAGMDFAAAVALLKPGPDRLVVHIRREFGPPEPQNSDPGIEPSPAVEGDSLPVIACATDLASDVRPEVQPPDRSDAQRVNAERAFSPQDEGHVIGRSNHPAAEDRGYTLADVEEMARRQRLSVVYTGGAGGVYVVQGVLGTSRFTTLAECVAALKYGRW